MANIAYSAVLLLILLPATAAQTFQPQQVACAGVKRALYATDLEVAQDPCDFSCSFNARTGSLQAQCRYDYCEACSTSDETCGVRVVQIDTVITQDDLDIYTEGRGVLDLGAQKKFCIDYTQGPHVGMTCLVVDASFPLNVCDTTTLPHGLPLLGCNENGCQCASADAQVDWASPYSGFSTLNFDACYVGSAVEIMRVPDSESGAARASLLALSVVAMGLAWGAV